MKMKIGGCRVRLRLAENHSLKGKRSVVKSITARVKNRFNVSIAEVDDHDLWQVISLGITCVSNNSHYANEVLSRVVSFIEGGWPEAELLDYEIEIIPAL